MSKKEQRFESVHMEGNPLKLEGVCQVIVDKETGVNYLFVKNGYSGGLTPLLDAEGKPIITKK